MTQLTYKDAGVDIDEGARAVEAINAAEQETYTPEVIGDLGGFGGLFSAAAIRDMQDPILVSGTDGVGTKLELAQRLGNCNDVGIDLVAMCANDIVTSGARPLFFLDYMAVGKLDAAFAAQVVGGIANGCKQAGCALIGGEMAEHPGTMAAGDFDLSGFCVGVVERSKMIGPDLVRPGDIIFGLASSGLHSNGYSLVRKAYTDSRTADELAAMRLADGTRVAEALLAPTRIYVKPLLAALDAGIAIHAAAHITGGGITNNLDRAMPAGLVADVKLGTWDVPEIIQEVAEATGLEIDDLLATFNMGIGMALIAAPEAVEAVTRHFLKEKYRIFRIGEVVCGEDAAAPGKVAYRTKTPR
jgi:phosphoribosylformylglycinamidine cyclo-ligase